MPTRIPPDRFRVAFSYAGEQRDLVCKVAEAVEEKLGSPNVFFDKWFEHDIAGQDADLRLQRIYGRQCDLVVVCVSGRYGDKPWTQAEHRVIRARLMQARETGDERCVLPIRVGDGDVDGIPFNTIVPDIRKRTTAESVKLIVDRLNLILASPDSGLPEARNWPDQSPELQWPVADHSDVRVAFARLLTRTAPWQLLPVHGPSESGKSHITRQMLGNALRIPDLACGRFDFKGTTDMEAEVGNFIQHLNINMQRTNSGLHDSLSQILESLKQRAEPALLILDTYEAAGEAEEWVERRLLTTLIRAPWLRVVVAGQHVPRVTGTIWEANASPAIRLQPPPAADWYEYAKQHRPEVDLETVEKVCGLTDKATVLSQIFGPAT